MNSLISCIYHHYLDSGSLSRAQFKPCPITLDTRYSGLRSNYRCTIWRCLLSFHLLVLVFPSLQSSSQDDPLTLHIFSTQAFPHCDHYDVNCTTAIAFYIFILDASSMREGTIPPHGAQQCFWNVPEEFSINTNYQNINAQVTQVIPFNQELTSLGHPIICSSYDYCFLSSHILGLSHIHLCTDSHQNHIERKCWKYSFSKKNLMN